MSAIDDRVQLAIMGIDEFIKSTIDGRTFYSEEEVRDMLLDVRNSLQSPERTPR